VDAGASREHTYTNLNLAASADKFYLVIALFDPSLFYGRAAR
jgi:hypothetical protein